jgi:hypothetical protein
VFANRVLRRIFGPEGDEIIGGWRKLHDEELHTLYCSLNTESETSGTNGNFKYFSYFYLQVNIKS